MASPLFRTIVDTAKEQFIPTFFRSKTNINPHHRISMPRLRHFKHKGPIKLKLPANMYSQKEVTKQQASVANYHKNLDKRKQRQQANKLKKQTQHELIQQRKEFKNNKPVICEN